MRIDADRVCLRATVVTTPESTSDETSSEASMPKRECSSARVVPDCMVRSNSASVAALKPEGGCTKTARRGSQPTCTAPSGRNNTGIAGLSA